MAKRLAKQKFIIANFYTTDGLPGKVIFSASSISFAGGNFDPFCHFEYFDERKKLNLVKRNAFRKILRFS